MDDMKEECQKYGSVISLLIPRENPGKGQVRYLTRNLHVIFLSQFSMGEIMFIYTSYVFISLIWSHLV